MRARLPPSAATLFLFCSLLVLSDSQPLLPEHSQHGGVQEGGLHWSWIPLFRAAIDDKGHRLWSEFSSKLNPEEHNQELESLMQDYAIAFRDRPKRQNPEGPSLSIVNPLDVLRQKLMLEIARRRQHQSNQLIQQNDRIFKDIGKREVSSNKEENRRK